MLDLLAGFQGQRRGGERRAGEKRGGKEKRKRWRKGREERKEKRGGKGGLTRCVTTGGPHCALDKTYTCSMQKI